MNRIALLSASALAALALTACGAPEDPDPVAEETVEPGAEEAVESGEEEAGADASTLTGAVEGPWREDTAKIRDEARNPAETLAFFDLDPSGTIIEIWPGGGWYADILAPWISANGGTYIAAWPPIADGNTRATGFRARFQERFDGASERGTAQLVTFGPGQAALAEPGGADAVLTFRNIHNFMAAGFAETAFESFFDSLKPGGVLGVVEHRLPADRVQDPRAASGYVQQDYVIAMAQEAGFEFVAASEINANPADTADHPFGVWTLPPVGRTSALGQPADPDFDRAPYDAIGESDRMTLLFRKPATTPASSEAGE